MNPLLYKFPRSVRTGGREYPIGWDFRTCVWLVTVNEDTALAKMERLEMMLNRFYTKEIPGDLDEAVRLMAKFLNCGAESAGDSGDNGEEQVSHPPLFSYEKDGQAIYTAILQQYGVDLEGETVHWWKFLAMLGDLDERCFFVRLLRLRKGWLEGTLSKEERDVLAEMGESGMPPEEPIAPEEQAAVEQFLRELGEGG